MSANQDERLIATAKILQDLHAHWQPHPAQQEILHAIFYGGKKTVMVWAGRKTGKSELAQYFLTRHAAQHPGSGNYYFAPLFKQAKEIIWASGRLQKFIPKDWIANINHTECRITLKNGSFIKIDGSDNIEAYRGISPHAVVYDEVAQFDPGFHRAMNPNRLTFDAPLLVIGTPPESENFATELKDQIQRKDARGVFFNFPTESNPHISKQWLEEEKERLFSNGEEDTWYREYEAKFTKSGRNAIFPMLDEARHVLPANEINKRVKLDMHKMWGFVVADPGSTSCFGMLFGLMNPYTREFFILNELYETDQRYTSTAFIQPRMEAILEDYPHVKWAFVYDEAAAWWRGETDFCQPIRAWTPTSKTAMKRDPLTKEPWGLSIVKDALRRGKIYISDACPMLFKEMSNYHRTFNRAGDIKILKRDDHLIDCLRYMIWEAGYSLPEILEPLPKDPWKLPRRAYSMEEDLKSDSWYN